MPACALTIKLPMLRAHLECFTTQHSMTYANECTHAELQRDSERSLYACLEPESDPMCRLIAFAVHYLTRLKLH